MIEPVTYAPVWRIEADNKDITASLAGRLLELTINDRRGLESDTLDITLDDSDGQIKWPRRGVTLQVYLGYEGMRLYDHGRYVVDEIGYDGPPDRMSLRCKAPDLLARFKTSKTRSFDKTTIGAIVKKLAAENKLTAAITPALAKISIPHIDQTQESDLNFLTRLGERYGATAKIANEKLIFAKTGTGQSTSGKPLPVYAIHLSMVRSYGYTQQGRGEYTGVEAVWHDHRLSKRKLAKTGKKGTITTTEEVTAGSNDNVKRLKQSFPDEASAKAAAAAEWQRLQSARETLSLDVQHGLPGLRAETLVTTAGFKAQLNGDWVATDVTHTLSGGNGFSTRISLETVDDYETTE